MTKIARLVRAFSFVEALDTPKDCRHNDTTH